MKFTRFFAIFVCLLMIFGMTTVFADDSFETIDISADDQLVISPNPNITITESAEVMLVVEGAEELSYIGTTVVPLGETVTAGDVVTALLSDHELTGLEDGYISSIDGLTAGTFGGWDGWMYAVKYYVTDEDGTVSLNIDVPNVGINDYTITSSCVIVLYYADYGASFAGTVVNDDGMIELVTYSAVYDENYNVVEFAAAPLANAQFTLTACTVDENGEELPGETYVFESDENGLTKLHKDLREVPNGKYIGSIGKQSSTTAEVGEITVSLPEVVRHSDVFTVDVHPTPEEVLKQKVFFLMLGLRNNYFY